MSLHTNNSESQKIISSRYRSKIKNKNGIKVKNYEIKLLSNSFLQLVLVLYFIIATKTIVSCTGAITLKKILLSLLCSELTMFSSPICNIAFFSSIV